MIGWHYTTGDRLPLIAAEGLVPQLIDKPELLTLPGWDPEQRGIYVYPEPQTDFENLCMILDRWSKHRCPRIVLLEVSYRWGDVIRRTKTGEWISLTHTGHIDYPTWKYHDNEPVVILERPVPPRRLKVLGAWDLEAFGRAPSGERRSLAAWLRSPLAAGSSS